MVAELASADVTDWAPPLPIVFTGRWHHYIGFYLPLLREYFQPFMPYPYDEMQLSLTLQPEGLVLNGTEIVSHLWSLYRQDGQGQSQQPLTITCQVRHKEQIPFIDMKRHFKQNLKASTCIRYGKFGASVITVDMSVNNIDDMYTNFMKCRFNSYMGDLEQESTNPGYRLIVENKEKIEDIPVRVVGRGWKVERSVGKKTCLGVFWREMGGGEGEFPCLLGVRLKTLEVEVGQLEDYCHPDGFLYFTF